MSIESVITAIFTDDSHSDDSVIESSNVEALDLQEPVVESLPMEEADPSPNAREVQQPLPGMMRYGAACSNSNISIITFGPSANKFKLDTLETIALPLNNEYFNDISKVASTTRVLDLVFVKCAPDVYTAAVWEKLTQSTASVTLSGTIAFESMPNILPSLKNAMALNFHDFRVSRNGRLRDIAKYFPTSVEKLYFDSRGTSNSSFGANVAALYEGLFTNRHLQVPCLRELTLIVNDLPGTSSLQLEITRLAEMLKDGDFYAVVISAMRLHPSMFQKLNALGFNRSHDGFVEGANHTMELFNYWSTKWNGRNIVLGLADSMSIPTSPGKMPIIH
uniref:Uncharacterized protein n=1 Tax=Panagrolaimus davidi TaxID=227884 RepID=A0A914PQX3_9BILA